MPCKMGAKKRLELRETKRDRRIQQNPQDKSILRKRLEPTLQKDNEDHIAGKGYRRQQWTQGMEEARNDTSLAVGQDEEQKKEVILEAERDNKKVHFASLMDMCLLKKCEVRTPNCISAKVRVVLRGGHCKRRLWSPRSLH